MVSSVIPFSNFSINDFVLTDRGLTLTELLLYIMLSSILLIILGRFLIDFHQSREVSDVMMELQGQAQFAMEHIIYGYNRGENPLSSVNIRYAGLMWASSYHFDTLDILLDPNLSDPPDADLQYAKKKIFFPDYTTPQTDDYIGYYQSNQTLYQTRIIDPGGTQVEKRVIIPYLYGSEKYLKNPYSVRVNFWPGPGRSSPDAELDPNQLVSIRILVSKDNLSFTTDSSVSLRNW